MYKLYKFCFIEKSNLSLIFLSLLLPPFFDKFINFLIKIKTSSKNSLNTSVLYISILVINLIISDGFSTK